MADSYSWSDMREEGPSHLPGPDNFGWWAGIALLVAVVLHVIAFFALGHIKIALGFQDEDDLRTAAINLDQVEILPPALDDISPGPEEVPVENTASLLEEIDILAELPENHELDITPEMLEAEFAVTPEQALADGSPDALEMDLGVEFDLASELPDMGRTESPLPMAAEGQVIVDPGDVSVSNPALDAFTEEIMKKGADGTAPEGRLDGVVTLEDMVGLPENVLIGKKTMLPSDLLFEYNSAELRESARVGLMKLALLVERNPGLYCWIEGHTDLYGGDAFNLSLSQKRARAVKTYLVDALLISGDKIVTRGFGKYRPVVVDGTVEEQAPNRRVEIKMRRELPSDKEPIAPKAQPVPVPKPKPKPKPIPKPAPPKAVLVRPAVELPEAPVAPIIEEPVAPRATPVVPNPPRALPVEESPPRALPVD